MKALHTVLIAAILAAPGLASAQQFKRTELQRHDLTGTNMEVIVATVEAPLRTFCENSRALSPNSLLRQEHMKARSIACCARLRA